MTLEKQALKFATLAHSGIGQKRKYTGEDYIVHPIAVAEIVRSVPHTDAMIAAALLHDVVEDTPVTLEEIEVAFGGEVRELVDWLTDRKEEGNRKTRKAKSCARWANAPVAAKTIKLADIVDNSKSIFQHDPNFAKVYAGEVEALLDKLQDGDQTLLKRVKLQLEEYTGIIH